MENYTTAELRAKIFAIEHELRQAKQLAEQANVIKNEFMRNMEHDIRTPFNGVLAMTTCLRDIEEDVTKKEYLNNIAESAQELLDYCNSILDFSKIEAGMLAVVNKKFNFKKLVYATIKIERPAAICKKLALKLNYAANIPNILVGDYYRLQRVLINLISNAIKFTATGHVELQVALLSQTTKSVLLRFYIYGSRVARHQRPRGHQRNTQIRDASARCAHRCPNR